MDRTADAKGGTKKMHCLYDVKIKRMRVQIATAGRESSAADGRRKKACPSPAASSSAGNGV